MVKYNKTLYKKVKLLYAPGFYQNKIYYTYLLKATRIESVHKYYKMHTTSNSNSSIIAGSNSSLIIAT